MSAAPPATLTGPVGTVRPTRPLPEPQRTAVARAVLLLLVAGFLHASSALASCKTPLPSADLRSIDASSDVDPGSAIARARALLEQPSNRSGRRAAELYALIADADDTTSDDMGARAAIASARAALANSPDDATSRGLLLRLTLVEADTAETQDEVRTAMTALATAERRVDHSSLGYACLRLVRGRIEGRIGETEAAARDGIGAYAMSAHFHNADAQAEAAYQLSITYRRAGLLDEGLRMADEVIAYARSHGQAAVLANALYGRAQILSEGDKLEAATLALHEAREISTRLHDPVGAAFTDLELCGLLVRSGQVETAAPICAAADRGFREAQRADQIALIEDLLARIDLARGHAELALKRLTHALADDGRNVPPVVLPVLYRDYSNALNGTGRIQQAYAALRRSQELSTRADQRRRSLAVAVLNAKNQAERYEHDRASLEREVAAERERANSRELARRLALGLAVAAIAFAAVLAYFLRSSRRYARELHRQELVLRAVAENCPDALVLLDREGRARYANRALFDAGVAPDPKVPLADQVPAAARGAVEAAVKSLLNDRTAAHAQLNLPLAGGTRHFELRGLPIVARGELIGATLQISDVTDQRTLEREILEVASRERSRLSSELHEGLGQELTGLSMSLGAVSTSLQRGRTDVGALLTAANDQVQKAIETTRGLARGMSPVQIQRGSLSTALVALAREAGRDHPDVVSCDTDPAEITTRPEIADQLYRIADEAIRHAVRRRGCHSVHVSLYASPDALELDIEVDDPDAFAPGEPHAAALVRLLGYRARVAGGELICEGVPDGRSRLAVSVPGAATPPAEQSLATSPAGASADSR